jgi:adenylate cyclase
VLPFENLSGDANQEFFSDGMTEEITAALAKIPALRVVGRTSAFRFKAQSRDLRAIGRTLGATYLIEGSVRKAGDRVRVNAELVKAEDGIDLWSDNYDRELKDIFATQEDIAQAIAGALRVPLNLQEGERLVSNRTGDLESYQQYLRARAMYRARTLDEAIKILETLVARDPSFAPAWAQLARVYILLPNYSPVLRMAPVEEAKRFVQSNSDKAEMAAREAVRLDSKYAGGYSALADIGSLRGKWGEAEDLYRQALSLDANDPDALSRYGMMLNNVGRLKESLQVSEQLQMIEPFVPIYNLTLASYLQVSGQDADSIRLVKGIPQDTRTSLIRNTVLARGYATQGRFAEAADTLLLINGNQVIRHSVEDAARWIRTAPAKGEALKALPAFEGELNFVYAYVGAPDRVLEFPERGVAINYLGTSTMWFLWVPQHAALRKTERFKTLVRSAGLVDYWRAHGWPDLCRPVGATDFACH